VDVTEGKIGLNLRPYGLFGLQTAGPLDQ